MITLTEAGAMGASTAMGAAAGMAAVTAVAGTLLKAAGRYLQKDMTARLQIRLLFLTQTDVQLDMSLK